MPKLRIVLGDGEECEALIFETYVQALSSWGLVQQELQQDLGQSSPEYSCLHQKKRRWESVRQTSPLDVVEGSWHVDTSARPARRCRNAG